MIFRKIHELREVPMKRIAIVTIESNNFGNRLQNLALQEVLELLGCSVNTIIRYNEMHDPGCVSKRIRRFIQTLAQTKIAKFRAFNKKIKWSKFSATADRISQDVVNYYDLFIAGSDQVWNPYYDFAGGKCDFLAFAKAEQKVSYAASFGVNEIPLDRRKEYAEYLQNFRAISVREYRGVEIVNELTGRTVDVVLDPTLLLDSEIWKRYERKSRCCPKAKYIFVYALGEKNERFLNKMEYLKEKYIVFDVRRIQKDGRELPVGPAEFLYLIRNAEMVLTDSFHATAFSLLFHKKFITYNRSGLNMGSRIQSLSKAAGINKYLNEFGDLVCEREVNYKEVDKRLEQERIRSIEFLRKAIED